MADWVQIILLGIIEGITEFLPISSTGHLLIAQQWLDAQSDVFNVVIQSGAVLAVVLIFRDRLKGLAVNWRKPEERDYTLKLGSAFVLTCIGGLALEVFGFELPETAVPVAWALIVGGILFIVIERHLKGRTLDAHVTWTIALAIGASQLLAAVFPGLSRSGATILVAMALGLNRKSAVEFSFLLGVPTLLAAGALKIFMAVRDDGLGGTDWGMLALGTLVSAVTAFVAVKWLLRYLQSHTFAAFGWYRIALGAIVLILVGG